MTIIFLTLLTHNDGKPIVISFWATWCKPCIKELNNIAEVYEDWQDETGVKVIAISIDDARNMSKVKPKVNALLWDYEVYCDPNGDLKRAMGVGSVPHTFLLNENKEIVYLYTGYKDGDEYDYSKNRSLIKINYEKTHYYYCLYFYLVYNLGTR